MNCLSDHSETVFSFLAGLSMMINAIEVHVIFDKNMKGPDSSSSLTIEELKFIKKARDSLFILKKSFINKNNVSKHLQRNKNLFTRSLALKQKVKRGEKILKKNITLKKPGTGIPSDKISGVINKTAKKDISENWLLKKSDFE